MTTQLVRDSMKLMADAGVDIAVDAAAAVVSGSTSSEPSLALST